ncbi:general secretion pathway protein GspK [Mesorhizobium sp. M2D.F.Ca.ET.223.01.1.1]|uniref:general secretion pathway protein GspK n=1 Tax=Mesorhizobium sp. M2D.F.Ca.ET.223.01.1.1 TaxID=2563940 RepID=UPI00109306D9|nr:general secretion pathway protein GspK [Mesorhizobium sp. M2D.F.Ca.ET.223.01.1.1]TGR84234.1 general secretion pathway protein GspK [Mesorhizobium sp. M2D.F.Ca.ET.223.01.1.1]TGT64434.1 general secretion pathway protein GspK [bacterium M00.F.Ca.ET.159.01.1.1]TGT79268.1 general secretion pathway protein GspK [bacterium M00.F.Ca.ET.157.01.1.1]
MVFDRDNDAGFALVAVLVFMLIVSAIVVPFAMTARSQLMIASNETEQQRLAMVADGLVNVVASELFDGSATSKLPQNAQPARCHAGHFSFELSVQDHRGLIDLNAANDQLLAQGLASFGFDPRMAGEIAKAIVTFRSPPNPFAGGTQPRSSLGPSRNKFAAFESVSELQEFSALASIPLRDLYAVFTVDLKQGAIVSAKAPNRLRGFVNTASQAEQPADPDKNGGSLYTIEVTARRDGSGIAGHAGFVVERSALAATGFVRLSRMPAAEIDSPAASVPAIGCDGLFGTAVAQILARWS